MFLVKKLVEVYGWNIIEEGEASKGAKFTITIPKLNKERKKKIFKSHKRAMPQEKPFPENP